MHSGRRTIRRGTTFLTIPLLKTFVTLDRELPRILEEELFWESTKDLAKMLTGERIRSAQDSLR